MHHMDGEKAWRKLHKNAASNIGQVLQSTPQSTSCMATYHPSQKLSKLDEPKSQAMTTKETWWHYFSILVFEQSYDIFFFYYIFWLQENQDLTKIMYLRFYLYEQWPPKGHKH